MILKTENDVRFAQSRFIELQNKLKSKYSPCEAKFARLLSQANMYFKRERANITINTRWCYYDFFIPSMNLYIEIDGAEHRLPERRMIDNDKTKIALSKGFLNFLIRFTNDEVKAMDRIGYDVLLKKVCQTDKANGNLRYVVKWIHEQIDGYDLMRQNRTTQFGEIMNAPVFMYDREINTIMAFESVFDLHNYTRLRCREIVERIGTDKVVKRRTARYAFDVDVNSLSKKIETIWVDDWSDDITLCSIKPFKQDLKECLKIIHSGAIGLYPSKTKRKKITNRRLF